MWISRVTIHGIIWAGLQQGGWGASLHSQSLGALRFATRLCGWLPQMVFWGLLGQLPAEAKPVAP